MLKYSSGQGENILLPSGDVPVPEGYVGRYDHAYFYGFLLALLLCWSPSNIVAYVAPWVVIGWFLLATRSSTALRNLLFVLAGWLASVSVAALLTPDFAFHSAALILLTYGSFLFVTTVPTKFVGGSDLMERMLAVARWVVLFQGSWGIVQAVVAASRTGTFDGATGDAVAGTIRPFALVSDLSNPMFAINMSFLLLILLPSLLQERKGWLAYAIGVLSLILASVLHVLLFLAIALVAALVIIYPSLLVRKNGVVLVAVFAIAAILAVNVLSGNFSTVRNFVRYTLEGRTPRAAVVVRTFSEIPEAYPWMPLVGLGPGQFSSRAGLIGTGMYFGSPANPIDLPLLPEGMSEPFEKNVLDLWLSLFFDRYGNNIHTMDNTSSTVQPFFSWLSVYTEFGAVAFVGLVALCGWLVVKVKGYSRTPAQRLRATALTSGIFFLFMLGLQENYWEVPQAILVGVIFLKTQYANLVYRRS